MKFYGKAQREASSAEHPDLDRAPEPERKPRKPKIVTRNIRKAQKRGLISERQMKKIGADV